VSFEKIKNIYFLGIGGIGMSALARYFKSQGKFVSGYDKTPSALIDELIAEGIEIHFEDDINKIPDAIRNPKSEIRNQLVVLTPAIPKEHSELNYFLKNDFNVMKRSQVLGLITQNSFTIAVAGTHGKTTTSSMIVHILKSSGVNCTAFLGGIAKNYNSNFMIGSSAEGKNICVVEADEYDRSFLTLHPDVAVITSMDADHLDIYGDKKFMEESYCLFAQQVKSGGKLFYKKGLPLKGITGAKSEYAVNDKGDYSALNIRVANHRYQFDWKNSTTQIANLTSEMPGLHNVENAVAAIAVARYMGISEKNISEALRTYTGVKRRFDYQLQNDKVVYIDDYAHHPEELRAAISSAKELYKGKKITGIFQPHLFSRTRDFVDGFAETLSLLDKVILLDIYPARELPIEGVTSKIIFDKISVKEKILCKKEEVLNELSKRKIEVLMTLGAGDIDTLVAPIKNYLEKKYEHV
jgi:UDP-N-acetylmuramate--alanine ligase